ncbi:MAG: tetratricopeptide repeat protein [Acidobacteriaceae bacterium]|nr:tetratricopeptide repeat protein [Acidobacteriaceae bacterium]
MHELTLKPFTGRTPAVLAGLTILAVLGFLGVGRLVNRFQEQQKALARHLYQRGFQEQQSGKLDPAVEHFRGALGYDPDNFQYQLSLARALRDSGRTDEAETYLISLWERSPQNGAVNLALGRLAVRQAKIDKIIQYYHNAIYGVWDSNPEQNRLNAWFELVQVLLHLNARPQAQAELIALSVNLPPNPTLLMQAAGLFAQAQDYDHALGEYRRVLQIDRTNEGAAAGAAEMAFKLGRYRTAERFLELANKANPQDEQISKLLQICKLILQQDPFTRGLSAQDRNIRIRGILEEAGKRLDTCMASQNREAELPEQATGLSELKTHWTEMNRRLRRLGAVGESGLADEVMDLVLQVEQQTSNCAPSAQDQALLLLAQSRAGAEQ